MFSSPDLLHPHYQGQLSIIALARGWDSRGARGGAGSPTFTPLGLALSVMPRQARPAFPGATAGEDQGQVCTALRRKPRRGTSAWALVETWVKDIGADSCCFRAKDPDKTFSTGWDLAMASDGSRSHSPEALPPHPHISSSSSLHNAQTVPLLAPNSQPHICSS